MTKIEAMIEVLNGDFKIKAKSPLGNFITLTHTGTLTWNHKAEFVVCDNLHSTGYEIVKDELGMRIFHAESEKKIRSLEEEIEKLNKEIERLTHLCYPLTEPKD